MARETLSIVARKHRTSYLSFLSQMAGNKKKRLRQRMKKEERNDGKFWAEGGRETILQRWIPEYTAALQKGWVEERQVMRLVRREYDYHVDWRLPDNEEPPQPFREWTQATPRESFDLTEEEEAERAERSEFLTKVNVNNGLEGLMLTRIWNSVSDAG